MELTNNKYTCLVKNLEETKADNAKAQSQLNTLIVELNE